MTLGRQYTYMYTLYSEDYIQTMYLTEIPSAQCVSLQRDVFGRHGFERLDKEKTGSTVSALKKSLTITEYELR